MKARTDTGIAAAGRPATRRADMFVAAAVHGALEEVLDVTSLLVSYSISGKGRVD